MSKVLLISPVLSFTNEIDLVTPLTLKLNDLASLAALAKLFPIVLHIIVFTSSR